jgi:hypothetical protein
LACRFFKRFIANTNPVGRNFLFSGDNASRAHSHKFFCIFFKVLDMSPKQKLHTPRLIGGDNFFLNCRWLTSRSGSVLVVALLAIMWPFPAASAPPYSGTIFLDPDIITSADPTAFTKLEFAGRGQRLMFDRLVNNFVQLDAFLFKATFNDLPSVEIQVNPEFANEAAASTVALQYVPVIGRLPRALRRDVKTVWIHRGDEAFGGGNNNLLIHTGSIAQGYIADGILEETLVHEASHT